MDKILLINKPSGMTSFDVVHHCKRLFQEKRIGHTGTLDPNATGLLIVLLGKYTKLLPYCIKNHKHYQATFQLGFKTDTEDIWGKEIGRKEIQEHTQEALDHIAKTMLGKQLQIPPMYSAKKINGKKLYELAWEGKEVERKPNEIEVSHLTVTKVNDDVYEMNAIVSSGTYIRTLIQDYAKKIDEYATMTSLKRIAIEHITLNEACLLAELTIDTPGLLPSQIIDPSYEIVQVDCVNDIKNGKAITLQNVSDNVVLFHGEEILAAYKKGEDQRYHCLRGLF